MLPTLALLACAPPPTEPGDPLLIEFHEQPEATGMLLVGPWPPEGDLAAEATRVWRGGGLGQPDLAISVVRDGTAPGTDALVIHSHEGALVADPRSASGDLQGRVLGDAGSPVTDVVPLELDGESAIAVLRENEAIHVILAAALRDAADLERPGDLAIASFAGAWDHARLTDARDDGGVLRVAVGRPSEIFDEGRGQVDIVGSDGGWTWVPAERFDGLGTAVLLGGDRIALGNERHREGDVRVGQIVVLGLDTTPTGVQVLPGVGPVVGVPQDVLQGDVGRFPDVDGDGIDELVASASVFMSSALLGVSRLTPEDAALRGLSAHALVPDGDGDGLPDVWFGGVTWRVVGSASLSWAGESLGDRPALREGADGIPTTARTQDTRPWLGLLTIEGVPHWAYAVPDAL
ncbi:MAG: hypothetical protein H6737_21685 [Alphaproteobacteria bacterium]|nr:hypothetical protein [Alphaproteobacteria bacterium]